LVKLKPNEVQQQKRPLEQEKETLNLKLKLEPMLPEDEKNELQRSLQERGSNSELFSIFLGGNMFSRCKKCGKEHQIQESSFCSIECALNYFLDKDNDFAT
jgi:hypothetical protein